MGNRLAIMVKFLISDISFASQNNQVFLTDRARCIEKYTDNTTVDNLNKRFNYISMIVVLSGASAKFVNLNPQTPPTKIKKKLVDN